MAKLAFLQINNLFNHNDFSLASYVITQGGLYQGCNPGNGNGNIILDELRSVLPTVI